MLDRSATCVKIHLRKSTRQKNEEEDVEDVLAEEVLDLDDKVFLVIGPVEGGGEDVLAEEGLDLHVSTGMGASIGGGMGASMGGDMGASMDV
jgi:hypothetical protein